MHTFVSTRGSLYRISDGTRLCTNCARIQRFHTARDSFERKADSPICWKRWQLELREGAVGVEFGAPKAGALPGCATPRHEVRDSF
jgi:hypothetical protein